jgi:hypothetical protein
LQIACIFRRVQLAPPAQNEPRKSNDFSGPAHRLGAWAILAEAPNWDNSNDFNVLTNTPV